MAVKPETKKDMTFLEGMDKVKDDNHRLFKKLEKM